MRHSPVVPLLLASLLAGCGGPPSSERLRLLSLNVGNPDDKEPRYPLRLSYQAYEDYVGQQIRAQAADLIFLQEVLPTATCVGFTESDPRRTCFDAARRPAAAQRLVGGDYTVVCDGRKHVECIAVRKSFATVEGLALGAFAEGGAETPPLPLPACDYFKRECDDKKCDAEANVAAVWIRSAKGRLRLVHLHPNAAGITKDGGAYLGEPCRYEQLKQALLELSVGGPTIAAGDYNTDPALFASAREKELLEAVAGKGKRMSDLTAVDPTGGNYATRREGLPAAIDRVLVEGLRGSCIVLGRNPASPDPGTVPIDDGFDFSPLPMGSKFPGRLDHLGVRCDLERL